MVAALQTRFSFWTLEPDSFAAAKRKDFSCFPSDHHMQASTV